MTSEELDKLEADSGMRLPDRYRSVLLDYPQALLNMADVYPMKKGPPQRVGPETAELYNGIELLRFHNVEQAVYRSEIFPAGFFIIGDSNCGDFYAIDTLRPNAPVYTSGCHDEPLTRNEQDGTTNRQPLNDSIDDWVARLLARNAP